jgi:hypothetical protein
MKPVILLILIISSAPASLPLEEPLNTWLYHSETFGPLLSGSLPAAHMVNLTPESRSEWIWQLIQDKASIRLNREDIIGWRFSVSAEALNDQSAFESRAGGMAEIYARPLDWLSISERISLWTGSDGNPPSGFSPFHFGIEHGRHLYVDWGYATAHTGPLDVSMGRIPMRWGPGRFSQLLISGNAPALDVLKIDLDLGSRITFSGFTATVNSDSSTWLSAHRLDITPIENLRVGLSEAVLYTAGGIDLAYANLILPWYPVQWNEREDDNAFLTMDATWRPLRGLALYGEFLIDDIQYENINSVPNKLGYTFGADGFHPESGLGAVVEYTAVQRYVYSQRKVVNYYLHDGRIIGCPLGPDADMMTAALSWCGIPGITAELRGSYTRNGEADVYEGWPDSVQAGGPFPSGIVETTGRLSLDVGWYPDNWLEVRLGGFISDTRNTGNIDGEKSSNSGISLQAVTSR